MKTLLNIFFVLIFYVSAFSQDRYEDKGFLRNVILDQGKLIFTDNYYSSIYLYENNKLIKLIDGPGCGLFYAYDRKRGELFFKEINKDYKQRAVSINLNSYVFTSYSDFLKTVGQPSFSDNKICFSEGNKLKIIDKGILIEIDLGYYSNLTPISPDGNFICFNDSDDQIFILDISNKEKIRITDKNFGYFDPKWSFDSKKILLSRLDGILYIFDTETKILHQITEGFEAKWMDNSKILFYKKFFENDKLINTDIYIYDLTSNELKNLTNSTDVFEIDPYFDADEIVYSNILEKEIWKAKFDNFSNTLIKKEKIFAFDNLQINYYEQNYPTAKVMDIPYVNQVYDTPDWFNGHSACGATTAIMLIAYHKILPPWETRCSTPSFHYNYWGSYVSEKYRFKGMYYSLSANDPNNRPAYGGFGYTWNSGSPYSKLSSYYNYHGISAVRSDSPPHSEGLAQINLQRPYTMCVGLTTSGHIVLAHGIGTEEHTFVVNDPYGDKNRPGYPNYYGKNARYDWPGYNNGFQNFKTVYWCISSNYVKPAVIDTLVDDLDFADGFTLNLVSPAIMDYYYESTLGFKNHLWWTYTKNQATTDICFAKWTPNIKTDGIYEVAAYIGPATATDCNYKIYHKNGNTTVKINQQENANNWVILGNFHFAKGQSGYVKLGDQSSVGNEKIVFDAIKFVLKDSVSTNVKDENLIETKHLSLKQNYPNPFNPSTMIEFSVPLRSNVRIDLYNSIGEFLYNLINQDFEAGEYKYEFIPKRFNYELSTGVYFYRMTIIDLEKNKETSITRKMTLIK